jgi:hypothetical protein
LYHPLPSEGLDENANNLILMHRELAARWLLIWEDLEAIYGNQSMLQSQVDAQAATSCDGISGGANPNLLDLTDLSERVNALSLPKPHSSIKMHLSWLLSPPWKARVLC